MFITEYSLDILLHSHRIKKHKYFENKLAQGKMPQNEQWQRRFFENYVLQISNPRNLSEAMSHGYFGGDVINGIGVITKNKINNPYLDNPIVTNENTYFYFINVKLIRMRNPFIITKNNLNIDQLYRYFFGDQCCEILTIYHINHIFSEQCLNILKTILRDENLSVYDKYYKLENKLYNREKLIFTNVKVIPFRIVLNFNYQDYSMVIPNICEILSHMDSSDIPENVYHWCRDDIPTYNTLINSRLLHIIIMDNDNIDNITISRRYVRMKYDKLYMKYMDEKICNNAFIKKYNYDKLDKYLYDDLKNIILKYLNNSDLTISFTDTYSLPYHLTDCYADVDIRITYKEIHNITITDTLYMIVCDDVC